jgi:hypothetical protein
MMFCKFVQGSSILDDDEVPWLTVSSCGCSHTRLQHFREVFICHTIRGVFSYASPSEDRFKLNQFNRIGYSIKLDKNIVGGGGFNFNPKPKPHK